MCFCFSSCLKGNRFHYTSFLSFYGTNLSLHIFSQFFLCDKNPTETVLLSERLPLPRTSPRSEAALTLPLSWASGGGAAPAAAPAAPATLQGWRGAAVEAGLAGGEARLLIAFWLFHGCCWETFCIFAYCGFVWKSPLNS